MTILIALAPGTKGVPALHLGAVLARSRVEDVLVCTVVKTPWPPDPNQSDREFLELQRTQAEASLAHAKSYLGDGPLRTEFAVSQASSIAAGLMDTITARDISAVVLGSSSAGVLGRVMLGVVAGRILNTAEIPVYVAPRNFEDGHIESINRMSVAFGRADHDSSLLIKAAAAANELSAALRVVCFAVRPMAAANEAVELGAEEALVQKWQENLKSDVNKTMATVKGLSKGSKGAATATTMDVLLGQGSTWGHALNDVPWRSGDVLVVGTSTGPLSRFFLGSHAAKIIRNSPVPVLLLPRY